MATANLRRTPSYMFFNKNRFVPGEGSINSVVHELDDPGGGIADDDPGGGSTTSADADSALNVSNTSKTSSSPLLSSFATGLTSSLDDEVFWNGGMAFGLWVVFVFPLPFALRWSLLGPLCQQERTPASISSFYYY